MLTAGCPRCPAPVTETAGEWRCVDHGVVPPLWRPASATYEAFAEHLHRSRGFPTYLPWPMSPGWRVTDFGVVTGSRGPVATSTTVVGTSPQDGAVELVVVSEEAGVGLGARCAGTVHSDPGAEIADGPPTVRLRLDSQTVPLWPVSTSDADSRMDRSVVAGEAGGRWLWIVLRPASAVLLFAEERNLSDVSGIGGQLLDLPFGAAPPAW